MAPSSCGRTSRSFVGPRSAEITLAPHRAADEFEALQVGILLPVLPDTPQMIVPHSKASSVVTSAKPIWVFCWIVSDRMGYARSRLNENE